MFYAIWRIILKIFCILLFRLEIKGQDYVKDKRNVIVASNHMSNLDPIIVGVAFPRNLSFMAKEELFKNKLFACVLRLLDVFPVKRGARDVGAVKECIKRLKAGKSVALFPQGTRGSLKIHSGVGFIASKSGKEVIPARICGTDEALPRGAEFFRLKKVKIIFGEPLSCISASDYKDFSLKVVDRIFNLY